MSASTCDSAQPRGHSPRPPLWAKVWRETASVFHRRTWNKLTGTENRRDVRRLKQEIVVVKQRIESLRVKAPMISADETPFEQGTVEPEGLSFLARLVKMSHRHPGP